VRDTRAKIRNNTERRIAVTELGEIPLTGLARKILRAAEILN
jgi:hypothetical protein